LPEFPTNHPTKCSLDSLLHTAAARELSVLGQSQSTLQFSSSSRPSLCCLLSGDQSVEITPCNQPPASSEVRKWLREKCTDSIANKKKLRKIDKTLTAVAKADKNLNILNEGVFVVGEICTAALSSPFVVIPSKTLNSKDSHKSTTLKINDASGLAVENGDISKGKAVCSKKLAKNLNCRQITDQCQPIAEEHSSNQKLDKSDNLSHVINDSESSGKSTNKSTPHNLEESRLCETLSSSRLTCGLRRASTIELEIPNSRLDDTDVPRCQLDDTLVPDDIDPLRTPFGEMVSSTPFGRRHRSDRLRDGVDNVRPLACTPIRGDKLMECGEDSPAGEVQDISVIKRDEERNGGSEGLRRGDGERVRGGSEEGGLSSTPLRGASTRLPFRRKNQLQTQTLTANETGSVSQLKVAFF